MEQPKGHRKDRFPSLSVHFLRNKKGLKAVNVLLQGIRFSLLLVNSGKAEMHMNGEMVLLRPRELIIVPERIPCSITRVSKEPYIGVLTFTRSFAFGNMGRKPQSTFFMSLMAGRFPKVKLKSKEVSFLLLLITLLDIKNKHEKHQGDGDEVLQLGFYMLIWELNGLYRKYNPDIAVTYTRKHRLAMQFFDTLGLHCKRQHQVRFYAKRLNVTADYLSKTLKQITGKTAKGFIKDSLLKEAKTLLHDPIEIKGISRILGFNSIHDFSKFFKRYTSLSPTAYRKRLHT